MRPNLMLGKDMELKLGKTLKACMEKRRISARELGKLSGVPASNIGEWLSNRSPKNLSQLKSVSEVLGETVHFLLWGEQDPNDPIQQILKEKLFSGTFEVTVKKVKLPWEEK